MKLIAWTAVVAIFASVVLYALANAPEPTPLMEQVGNSMARFA